LTIHNLFPIPIGSYKIGRELTLDELKYLDGLLRRPNVGNATSCSSTILESQELSELTRFILGSLKSYFIQVYDPLHDVKLKITQSWCNYTKPGQHHHKHNHGNSFISGVFYVKADKMIDKLYFYQDAYQQLQIQPKVWNLWNARSWWLEVGAGDLLLFPSALTHEVAAVEGTEERISISFNTFPIGILGDERDLTLVKV